MLKYAMIRPIYQEYTSVPNQKKEYKMFFEKNDSHNELIKKQILLEFGTAISCIALGEGTENKNFLINDTIVLRVLFIDKNSLLYHVARSYIEREITFANVLCQSKVNPLTYKCFKNKDRLLEIPTDEGTFYFLQYDFIPGSFLTYTKKNMQQLAQMMGKCHEIAHQISEKTSIPYLPVYDGLPSSLHYRSFVFDDRITQSIAHYAFYWQIFQENTRLINDYLSQNPNILIHCDLHAKNILLTNDTIAIIDFGDTRLSLIEEDIGTCFWGMALEMTTVETFKKRIYDFFSAYPKRLNNIKKTYCLRFTLQRFLDIHLFYLKENLSTTSKLKYQTQKFSNEKPIIDFLIASIDQSLVDN